MPASVSVASWIVNSVTSCRFTRPPRRRFSGAAPAEGAPAAAARADGGLAGAPVGAALERWIFLAIGGSRDSIRCAAAVLALCRTGARSTGRLAQDFFDRRAARDDEAEAALAQ